jgi:hypothetical protein
MNYNPSYDVSQLKKGWIEFLDRYKWTWFITLTFGRPLNENKADKMARVFMNKFNIAIYGRHHKGLFYVMAREYQLRGVIHFHILAGGPGSGKFDPYWLKEWWYSKFGIARIERIRNKEHSIAYLLKYVLKQDRGLTLVGLVRKLERNGLTTPVKLGHTGIEEEPGIGGRKVFSFPSLSLEALQKSGMLFGS